MAKPSDIDKFLEALEEMRQADERYAREAREADERYAREAREADEQLRQRIEKERKEAREADEQLRQRMEEGWKEAREADDQLRQREDKAWKEAREAAEQLRQREEKAWKETREAAERLHDEIQALTGTVGNYQGEVLECAAAPYVMRKLELEEGLKFREVLDSRHVRVNGTLREFDLYGIARRDGADVLVVGEVKRNPTLGDVVGFDTDTRPLVRRRRGRVIRVLFFVHISRKARREALRLGIRVFQHRRRPPRGA